jgi:ATP-dependent DNA ligase
MSATNELPRRCAPSNPLAASNPAWRDRRPSRRGPGWIHEIKHDGFRILAHRRARSVSLFSRNGHNFVDLFPLVAAAIEALPVR